MVLEKHKLRSTLESKMVLKTMDYPDGWGIPMQTWYIIGSTILEVGICQHTLSLYYSLCWYSVGFKGHTFQQLTDIKFEHEAVHWWDMQAVSFPHLRVLSPDAGNTFGNGIPINPILRLDESPYMFLEFTQRFPFLVHICAHVRAWEVSTLQSHGKVR